MFVFLCHVKFVACSCIATWCSSVTSLNW
uniref:Uncharacterized protein n=1 Tax=Oryza nivara TaxID=4536 RepID=A0A0E0GZV5_ORYNI